MFFQLLFLCPFFDTDSEYIFGIASESKPNDQGLTQSAAFCMHVLNCPHSAYCRSSIS